MTAPPGRFLTILCMGFLALLGCSKTQDTAPETRVFGDPPVIQSVRAEPTARIASCPEYEAVFFQLRSFCGNFPILMGGLEVQSKYTEVFLEATVTDPDDPPGGTDVLFVSGSYVAQSGNVSVEDTIVMFDDGSQILFPFTQKDDTIGRLSDCTYDDVNHTCSCTNAGYEVNSNDPTAADKIYSRGFSFYPAQGANIPAGQEGLFRDCVALGNGQATQVNDNLPPPGEPLSFRFEAVDKSGNLTEFPTRPSVTLDPVELTCAGDPCACCLMLNNTNPWDPMADGGCFGLPGLMFDPNGHCSQGDPALRHMVCSVSSDCDGTTGGGFCRVSPEGRDCPNGYCQNRLCLLP